MSATASEPAVRRAAATKEEVLALLARDPIPLEEVAAALDGMAPEARIAAARAVGGALQARLFEAAAKAPPLTVDDLVPPGTPLMATVRHFGRNSLPLFSLFEKRFVRPVNQPTSAKGRPTLYGYNHQPMAWLTGPGCMVAYDGKDGEVLVDYRELPEVVPAGWPAVRPNDRGFSKLVYRGMVDHLRRVSRHVSIGRAWRDGKLEDNWFILCREGE
jgi:hypothetical protein